MPPLLGTTSHPANGLASSSSVAPTAGMFAQNSLLPVLEPSQALGIPQMQTITQQLNASSIAQAQAAVLHRTTAGPPPQQQQQQQQQLSAAHISAGTGSIHQLHQQQQQQQQAMQQSQSQSQSQSHPSQQSTSFSQQQSSYSVNPQAQGRGGLTLNSDVQVRAFRIVLSALLVIFLDVRSYFILLCSAFPCSAVHS